MTTVLTSPDTEEVSLLDTSIAGGVNHYDTIIIGGGVAGLSAAIYTARDGFKTLVLEGEYETSTDAPGGALMLTSDIENFPGFVKGAGADLIDVIRTQAETFGAQIETLKARIVDLATIPGGTHTITTNEGVFTSRSVILATGAVARQLDVPGEGELYGNGVSSCATCDGAFFKDQVVAVVGGGDTAVEDALFLTRHASKVYLMPRSHTLRASGPEAREALAKHEDPEDNFEILWESQVTGINGDEGRVTSLTYHNADQDVNELFVEGVFVAIGRDPATSFLHGTAVNLDEAGYILTVPDSTETVGKAVGVFAAGDAVDKVYRQAATSAGKAVEAALQARHYLLSLKHTA